MIFPYGARSLPALLSKFHHRSPPRRPPANANKKGIGDYLSSPDKRLIIDPIPWIRRRRDLGDA